MDIQPGTGYRAAQRRLIERLQLPPTTMELELHFQVGRHPHLTVTWLVSTEEIDQISTWYEVEGLDRIPEGTTTYTLEPRAAQTPEAGPPQDCHPIDQQARQEEIEALYAAAGRHDPAHPAHGTYTGLVAQQGASRDTASADEVEEAL